MATKIALKKILLTFAVCGIIPMLGLIGSALIKESSASKFKNELVEYIKSTGHKESEIDQSKFNLSHLCTGLHSMEAGDSRDYLSYYCNLDSELESFEIACSVMLAVLFSSLIFISFLGWITKYSRLVHLIVFKAGVIIFNLFICAVVLSNAAILVAASYFVPAYFIGYYIPKLTMIFGFGALYFVYQFCRHSLSLISRSPLPVVGMRVFPSDHPKMWREVREIAKLANVDPPENILVGLEPNFFVTESKINAIGGVCSGRSLYISMSILKSLSQEEFKSILLHELGHFKGLDTLYSLHYSPIFRRLENAHGLLSSAGQNVGSNLGYLSAIPNIFMLQFFTSCFRSSHAAHNRTREELADDLAVRLTSNAIFASALIKAVCVSKFWDLINENIVRAAKEKKVISNVPLTLKNVLSTCKGDELRSFIQTEVELHPFDSHPLLESRLTRVGVDVGSFLPDMSRAGAESMFENPDQLEVDLTNLRYLQMDRLGEINLKEIFAEDAESPNKKATGT